MIHRREFKMSQQQYKALMSLNQKDNADCNALVHTFWKQLGKDKHFDYRTVRRLKEDGTFEATPT